MGPSSIMNTKETTRFLVMRGPDHHRPGAVKPTHLELTPSLQMPSTTQMQPSANDEIVALSRPCLVLLPAAYEKFYFSLKRVI